MRSLPAFPWARISRWPRFTLRAALLGVAVAALAARQFAIWGRMASEPCGHFLVHSWEATDGNGRNEASWCGAALWPRYWRRSIGLPWPGSYRCDCEEVRRGTATFPRYRLDGTLAEGGPTYRFVGTRRPTFDEAACYALVTRSLKSISFATSTGESSRPAAAP